MHIALANLALVSITLGQPLRLAEHGADELWADSSVQHRTAIESHFLDISTPTWVSNDSLECIVLLSEPVRATLATYSFGDGDVAFPGLPGLPITATLLGVSAKDPGGEYRDFAYEHEGTIFYSLKNSSNQQVVEQSIGIAGTFASNPTEAPLIVTSTYLGRDLGSMINVISTDPRIVARRQYFAKNTLAHSASNISVDSRSLWYPQFDTECPSGCIVQVPLSTLEPRTTCISAIRVASLGTMLVVESESRTISCHPITKDGQISEQAALQFEGKLFGATNGFVFGYSNNNKAWMVSAKGNATFFDPKLPTNASVNAMGLNNVKQGPPLAWFSFTSPGTEGSNTGVYAQITRVHLEED